MCVWKQQCISPTAISCSHTHKCMTIYFTPTEYSVSRYVCLHVCGCLSSGCHVMCSDKQAITSTFVAFVPNLHVFYLSVVVFVAFSFTICYFCFCFICFLFALQYFQVYIPICLFCKVWYPDKKMSDYRNSHVPVYLMPNKESKRDCRYGVLYTERSLCAFHETVFHFALKFSLWRCHNLNYIETKRITWYLILRQWDVLLYISLFVSVWAFLH